MFFNRHLARNNPLENIKISLKTILKSLLKKIKNSF